MKTVCHELLKFNPNTDGRGLLVALESERNIPFEIKRVYYITNLHQNLARGFHAHKSLKQVAVCVKGSCRFILDDGTTRQQILLSDPTQGLLIEEMIWREMDSFSEDCVILVLASAHYDEADYIRDYEQFKRRVNNG